MTKPAAQPPGIVATVATTFRQNRMACVLLNVFVATVVGTYYSIPWVADLWRVVGELKLRWSFAFSLVSTVFAAAVLPFVVQKFTGALPAEQQWRKLGLAALFWGWRGMEIDLFYRVQGWLFGQGNDALTLTKKVLVDQFVMSPLWFVPTYLVALRWVEAGGSWARTKATLDRHFWLHTSPTVLITNWLIWIPALILIFAMPAPLQFPLFAVVMCFFILIVTLMARAKAVDELPAAA